MKKIMLSIMICGGLVLLGVMNYNTTKNAINTCVENGNSYAYCVNGLK